MSVCVEAWIALGANLGARRANLEGALRAIDETAGLAVRRSSAWIETQPVGGPPGQPPYLNGVAELACSLSPRALLRRLQEIEIACGRDRANEERNGPRTLDLDVLFFGTDQIEQPGLVIPHPRLEERTFVLEPLATLIPERRLSRCGRTVRERLTELS
jgi:2-amino-4-hydroxy-6-hydroxymethyldihydropteridine diphosphokinase